MFNISVGNGESAIVLLVILKVENSFAKLFDSECKAALKSDAAVEIVVGAARIDLFPTFSFGGGNDNKVATAAVSASSPTSNESGKSLSSSGETKSTTASSFQKPKKAVKTRGALRARGVHLV